MQGQCCLQRFLPVVPLLQLPRLAVSSLSLTLLLHWDVTPLAPEGAMSDPRRGSFAWWVNCGVHPPSSVRVCVGGPPPPAWSSARLWLLRLRFGSVSDPVLLPAPAHVLHMSAPVRRGAVADARLGLCDFQYRLFLSWHQAGAACVLVTVAFGMYLV